MSTLTRFGRAATEELPVNAVMIEQVRTMRDVGAGVAHDAINALMTARCDLELLASLAIPPDGTECVRSLRSLTDHLLDLACGLRMAVTDPGCKPAHPETRLDKWWPAFAALLHSKIRPGVSIRPSIPRDLPHISIEPHHLTQVVLNLVGNALDAIQERRRIDALAMDPANGFGGEVRISVERAPNGAAVRLIVADNGIGMTPAVLARAREPYFTTKAGRGGTGLGLAIAERVVTGAGGSLEIESEAMEGTVVTVMLAVTNS